LHTFGTAEQSTLRVEDVLAGIADQVFALDREWRYVFVNDRVSEVTGLPRERLLGRCIWELLPEVLGTEFEHSLRRAAEARTPVRFEYFSRPLDRWFEARVYPSGSGIVNFVADVTDRKRMEEVLRRSHDTFFHLVENSPFGVYIVDAQFRLRQLSAGAQKVFSQVRPLLGRDFAEVLRSIWPEPFAEQAIARFRHTLRTGERYHSADTTERRHDIDEVESYDWQIERITLPSGEFGVVCYFYDLTELKRADRRIAELNADLRGRLEELESLMNVLPIAVFLAHDADCSRITANPAGAATLRLAPGANASMSAPGAAALPFRFLKDGVAVPPEALPMHRAARLGRPVLDEELEVAFGDGGAANLYGSAVPLFDEARRVRGCLGVFVEITERKRAEQALREADRRKDEFLATLSHELRNPLAPLRNSVYLLRSGARPDAAPRVLDMMDRQVGHLVRLVDDLMEVSRITRGTLELRRKQVPLEAALRGAIETADPLLRSGEHHLNLRLPRAPLVLDADPVRVAQVFANLLNNAAKYTDRGGVITLEAWREGQGGGDGERHRPGHRPGRGAASLPDVQPQRAQLAPHPGRARHRARPRAEAGGTARRHGRGAQRGPRQGQPIHRPPAARGGDRTGAGGAGGRRARRLEAARAGRRRQPRRDGEHGAAARPSRRGSDGGARRRAGAGCVRGVPAAGGAARHRAARRRRLFGRPPAPRACRGHAADHRGGDRLGTGRGQGARPRGRVRSPPREARRHGRVTGAARSRSEPVGMSGSTRRASALLLPPRPPNRAKPMKPDPLTTTQTATNVGTDVSVGPGETLPELEGNPRPGGLVDEPGSTPAPAQNPGANPDNPGDDPGVRTLPPPDVFATEWSVPPTESGAGRKAANDNASDRRPDLLPTAPPVSAASDAAVVGSAAR
jgi:PAS domain S-box-containing protein